jgi:RimJ/RimL family protein N-acetyltransferase
MKIQFIICGWWYDEFDGRKGITDFIDGLIELQKDNEFIDVFWSCHKEPTKLVKDNFKYKVFENVGLEWGAYNKAFNHLDLDDDTIVFCIQDDMVIKDWSFVNACVKHISMGAKIIGNGFNYPMLFKPQSEARLSYWLKTKDKLIDYVREENKHMFDVNVEALSIRGSFMCTRYDHIKQINGFEYVNKELTYGVKEDGREFLLTDPYGNTSLYLNAYKFTKYFGRDKMKWLSNEYRKSPYMIECGRGNIDLPQDKDTPPFNIPGDFLIDGPVEYEEDVKEFEIKFLKDVSYKEFKSFLDSLDEERKSWSLDLQNFKDEREFYNGMSEHIFQCIVMLDNDKIIALISSYTVILNEKTSKRAEISFVVKKGYQGRGLGTEMLLQIEEVLLNNGWHNQICGKHYIDNIGSHKAFLKAGYVEASFVDGSNIPNMVWKLKEIK